MAQPILYHTLLKLNGAPVSSASSCPVHLAAKDFAQIEIFAPNTSGFLLEEAQSVVTNQISCAKPLPSKNWLSQRFVCRRDEFFFPGTPALCVVMMLGRRGVGKVILVTIMCYNYFVI